MSDMLGMLDTLSALKQWEHTTGDGDPMVDVLLNDISRAVGHIEAQNELIQTLAEALHPFALVEIWDIGIKEGDDDLYSPMPENHAVGGVLRVKHFRRASDAWAKIPDHLDPKPT